MAFGRLTAWPFWFAALGLGTGLLGIASGRADLGWGGVWGAALLVSVAARAQNLPTLMPVFGVLYVTVPCVALVWLRSLPLGLETVLWLFAVVWATDIAAFATGSAFGGPKIAPAISPRKTWAGAAGGFLAAIVASVAFAVALALPALGWFALLGGIVSLAAQAGDFLESAIKRHYGVKDTSGLIPGHGGAIDRLDGLITATLLTAALTIWRGSSPLVWG